MLRFFPTPEFGWCFYGLLIVGLIALVYTDITRQRLPNILTVPLLLLGLVINVIRAAWLGMLGETGRFFGLAGTFGGIVEGLCFSGAGLLLGFMIFSMIWQLQKCGAGDVKLMAALGAWVGPLWWFFLFIGTIVAVVLVMIVWWAYAFITKHNPGLKLSYALPTLISASTLLIWFWRRDLFQ